MIANHNYVSKKPFDSDYFVLTEKTESSHKAPTFKVNDRFRITKHKNVFSKGYTKNWSREIFVIASVLKINPWTYKIKYFNRKKMIGSFYEKSFLLCKL